MSSTSIAGLSAHAPVAASPRALTTSLASGAGSPHATASPCATTAHRRPPGRLRDFFRYHGVWAPGVRLFRHLRFSGKAMVLTAVFLLPIIWLSLQSFTRWQDEALQLAAQRTGAQLLASLSLVEQAMLVCEETARVQSTQTPLAAAAPDHAAACDQARAAWLAVATQAQAVDAPEAQALHQLQQQWLSLGEVTAAPDGQMPAAWVALREHSLTLHSHLVQEYGLLLDANAQRNNLARQLLNTLPAALNASADLWGWGSVAIVRAGIGTEHERQWEVWDARLGDALADSKLLIEPALAEQLQALRHQGRLAVFDAQTPGLEGYYASAHQAFMDLALRQRQGMARLQDSLALRHAQLRHNLMLTGVILFVSLGCALYLFTSFRKVLEGGLREVTLHLQAMRDGRLGTRPSAWGADEVACLMHTIADLQGGLTRIVSQMRSAADHIVHASSEIATGSTDLAVRTEEAASSLAQSAGAMGHIAQTVQETAQAASAAHDLATRNAQQAQDGGNIMETMAATMSEIDGACRRIADISSAIDGIAFQTTLLALNAAVEAARAGESGRGFAVVASEVRGLAKRASEAAREIKSLVVDSSGHVDSGKAIVQQAGQAMRAIVGQTLELDHLLTHIAQRAQEQAQDVKQTTLAVHQMDGMTQQNAALVEETAAAAEAMRDQAQCLAVAVASFSLEASDVDQTSRA